MTTTIREVLDFVNENDVKFVKLAFCDLLGNQKNISIMSYELEDALKNGVSFDAHAIKGFTDVTNSDLFLFPDPQTLSVLPWRPQQGRVIRLYCDIKNPDGTQFWGDTRGILKNVIKTVEDKGYVCKVGAELEFYLFKTDEMGEPTSIPYDNGGYLDVAPYDKAENVRREICLCLEEMGIKPESSHHEQGPGQNEIDFKYSEALSSADNLLTFKGVVRTIAARNGLFASFCPKPIPNKSGNGFHMNLSLSKNGYNVFRSGIDTHSEADSFIAGVLRRIREITLFLNPIPNSYDRFGVFDAPKYVSWSYGNRSQLVRIPAAQGDKIRMELRSPDPATNPYLAYALVIAAGMEGIEDALELPPHTDADLYTADRSVTESLERLPENMLEAILLAKESDFVKRIINKEAIDKFLQLKMKEYEEYEKQQDKTMWFMSHYFKVY